MRLGYFTMPVHPLHRDLAETLREDREAIILADKLGFYDAFVGEHLTDKSENITNSMMFLATLIPETKNIKLATGTTNLSQMHPVLVAQHAAMFDHLSQGRFIFGVSPGALTSDAEALGILEQDRNKMFAEVDRRHPGDLGARSALRHRLPRQPLQGLDQPHASICRSASATWPSRYQKPRPEIVGTVVAPFSPGVIAHGPARLPSAVGELPAADASASRTGQNYCKGKAEAGVEPKVADWRVARTIFVRDDDKTAARYGRDDANSPYRFYWNQMWSKMKRGKRLYVFKSHKDQPDEEITLDYVLDHCMIHGSVNKIVDHILALREEIGDFGEMVYAGMDWVDPALEKRSMS